MAASPPRRPGALLAVLLVSWAAASVPLPLRAQYDLRVVARVGQEAPGAGGDRFVDLAGGRAYLSDTGRLLFRGGTGSVTAPRTGFWTEEADGEVRLVMRVGDPAPGLPAGVVFGDPFALLLQLDGGLDAGGRLVLYSPLDGPGVEHDPNNRNGRPVDDNAVFTEGPGGLEPLVRRGRLLYPGFVFPSGLTADLFAANPADGAFNGGRVVLLSGNFVYCCNTSGALFNSPGAHLARRLPGGGEEQLLFSFPPRGAGPMPQLPPYELQSVDGTVSPPVMNPSGQIAFVADGDYLGQGVRHFARCIYRADPAAGQPAGFGFVNLSCQLGTDNRLFRQPRHLTINAGGQVAFLGFQPGEAAQGVWILGGASPVPVARVGDAAPGASGATFAEISDFALTDSGRVALIARTSDGQEGAWITGPEGLEKVARAGERAPGTPEGVVFADLLGLAVNNAGQVALTARLSGPGVVFQRNERGLWAGEAGRLRLVIREGDLVQAAPGEEKVLRQLDVRNMFATPASPLGIVDGPASGGRPTHFNAEGDLVFGGFLGADPSDPDYVLLVASAGLVVNTTGDEPDASPGDEACDTGGPTVAGEPPCTLRAAIQEANARPGRDRIRFRIPESDPGFERGSFYIRPDSDLPPVTDEVSIEGGTAPVAAPKRGEAQQETRPLHVLDGRRDPRLTRGLQFPRGSRHSMVSNLAFINFLESALLIGDDDFLVTGCWFGLDPDLRPAPNAGDGIQIQHASRVLIGGFTETPGTGVGNRFAHNRSGLLLFGEQGRDNVVRGNVFVENELYGVYVLDAPKNVIGGDLTLARNVFGLHGRDGSAGIRIEGEKADSNRVEGNYVGVDADGTTRRHNTRGVHVLNAGLAVIGGSTAEPGHPPGNVISGNTTGIVFEGGRPEGSLGPRSRIQGNLIGPAAGGVRPAHDIEEERQRVGVEITRKAGVLIGGFTAAARNVISGNTTGIAVRDRQTTGAWILGNFIGLDLTGAKRLGNTGSGIRLEGSEHFVGYPVHDLGRSLGKPPGNVISGNRTGVEILPGSSRNLVGNNVVGLTAAEEPLESGPPGNTVGVRITDASENDVGWPIPDTLTRFTNHVANVLAGNDTAVVVTGRASVGNLVGSNYIGINRRSEQRGLRNGIVILKAQRSRVTGNFIHFAQATGVRLLETRDGSIEDNSIGNNDVGVHLTDALGDAITNNGFSRNRTGIRSEGSTVEIKGNAGVQNGGGNTTIHLDGGRAEIAGNRITGDAADAIVLENGAFATVSRNNLFDNAGFALRSTGSPVVVPARGNWWGDASGPGGAGPGSGDEVSAGVDFAGWLAVPVSVVVSAGPDTLYLDAGVADTARVFFRDWSRAAAPLDVTLSDERGWIQGARSFPVALDDSTGGAAAIPLLAPGGAEAGSTSRVRARAASRDNPSDSASDSFLVVVYRSVLREIVVAPDTARLAPGETTAFAAAGLDQQGRVVEAVVTWSATGGAITEAGVYTAGETPGRYAVTAADAAGQIEGRATVVIGTPVGTEAPEDGPPRAFALHPGYPNPFNPRVTIPYDVKEPVRVVLVVYDLLGREVARLVDEPMGPGRYRAVFEAGRLPSGVYFCVIRMGGFRGVRKLVLVK